MREDERPWEGAIERLLCGFGLGPPVVQGNGERIFLPDALLSVGEVARRLDVSRATVYALVERRELPHLRILNAIRVEPETLAAYLAQQKRG